MTLVVLSTHLFFIPEETSVDKDATRLYKKDYEYVAMTYAVVIGLIAVASAIHSFDRLTGQTGDLTGDFKSVAGYPLVESLL